MFSLNEIYTLINNAVISEDGIKTVLLNGSHIDPSVEKDNFQNFDIVFVVRNMISFIEDSS